VLSYEEKAQRMHRRVLPSKTEESNDAERGCPFAPGTQRLGQ
jgi:hypothetical protein